MLIYEQGTCLLLLLVLTKVNNFIYKFSKLNFNLVKIFDFASSRYASDSADDEGKIN